MPNSSNPFVKKNEKIKKVTLGSYMSMTDYAANQYINNGDDLEGIEELNKYGQTVVNQNKIKPSSSDTEAPALDSGEIKQDSSYIDSLPNNSNAKGNVRDTPSVLMGTSNYLFTTEGAELEKLKFTKNSLAPVGEEVLTGHSLLASEGTGGKVGSVLEQRGQDLNSNQHYAAPDESTRPIASAVYNMLVGKNMYHPSSESPFVDYSKKGEAALKHLFSHQNKLGEFDPQAKTLSVKELGKVALEILLEAQSESALKTSLADTFSDKGRYGELYTNMVLFPHATQAGFGTVGVANLRARVRKGTELGFSGQDDLLLIESFESILGVGSGGEPEGHRGLAFIKNGTSYGTMNSPVERFAGAFPTGMIMPVVYSVLLVGMFGVFIPSLITGLKSAGLPVIKDPENPETLALGKNIPRSRDNGIEELLESLGLTRLESTGGWSSVMAGLMLFYGFQKPLSPTTLLSTDLISLFMNIFRSPGYYLVITKRLLSDTSNVVQTFSDAGSAFGSNNTSFFEMLESTLNAIESITSSFVFKFFVRMAQTGAQAIKGYSYPGMDGHGSQAIPLEDQRNIVKLNPKNRMALSRIHSSPETAESPLSLRRHVSALLPSIVSSRMGLLEMTAEEVGDADLELGPVLEKDAVSRITPEFIDAIEGRIDAEYVPFSIQDMRTNEIFSLPAFITSITDDFSIQHGQTHGFGRTDPVFVHSKTNRSINLVFNIVSMNKEDHQYMYYIVNKLVAMCYPQRDRGLIRKTSDQIFAQPFSQIPVGSPVIRIRLGDLIQSNKSSYAMEKIFGGKEILTLDGGTKVEEIESKSAEKRKKEAEYYANLSSKRANVLEWFKTGDESVLEQKIVVPAGTTVSVQKEGDDGYISFISQVDLHTTIIGSLVTKAPPGAPTFKPGEAKEQTIWKIDLSEVTGDTQKAIAYGGKTLASNVYKSKGTDFSLAAIASALGGGGGKKVYGVITRGTKIRLLNEDLSLTSPMDSSGGLDKVNNFLSSETNPVVRSFSKSSAGKGLAGVITQLSFTYDGAIWGTGEDASSQGLVAPMRIQINLGFSPIHDMPLGIDYTGDLIAPSHPAGFYSKKSLEETPETLRKKLEDVVKRTPKPSDDSLEDPTSFSFF